MGEMFLRGMAVVMAIAMAATLACVPLPAELPCPEGSERYDEYRLFFGRSAGGDEVVSEEEWRAFLADTVTPRFPDGLSVFDAAGQWRDTQGVVVRERSKMVLILAEQDSDALTRLDEIAEEYRKRFSQESVLRVVDSACVAF